MPNEDVKPSFDYTKLGNTLADQLMSTASFKVLPFTGRGSAAETVERWFSEFEEVGAAKGWSDP